MISKLEENKILTQIYRWFSFYENTSTLSIQKSILSKNITIDSGLDKVFGIDEYLEKVILIPENWISIYNLKNYEIEKRKNGSYVVETFVEYDNIGVEEDMKSLFSYVFSLKFEKCGKKEILFPLIQSVKISTLGKSNDSELELERNEIYELIGNLFVLIGRNNNEIDDFKELLGSGFILNFENREINSIKAIKKYVSYNNKEYKKLDYYLDDFEIIKKLGNKINLEAMITLYSTDRKSNENKKEMLFDIEVVEEENKLKILKIEKIN